MTIRVALTEQRDASYDILIGRGLLADLPALVKAACPASRYAVLTDSHVAQLYGEKLVARCHDATLQAHLFEFPAGEQSKTRETWAAISDGLFATQFGRDSAVIALGGGVVGDLAGFVAATYLRGIPCVQVPTTLLAMIDSSIGGKAGVDVPAGKNLLGAFHQPRLVVADLDVLGSLPPPQLAAGMAEAVKHGVIADRQYCDALERDHEAVTAREAGALERVVRRSVEIKAEVVAADEREAGRRAILNFGHTVGHALEASYGYRRFTHGEAVSIGMVAASRLSVRVAGLDPRSAVEIEDLLRLLGLPVRLSRSPRAAFWRALGKDKKRGRTSLRMVLSPAIGAAKTYELHSLTPLREVISSLVQKP